MEQSERSGPPRRERPPRYPAPAPSEDGCVPYDEYAPFEQIASPLASGDVGPWPVRTEDASPALEMGSSGLLAGLVTGILGAAVALGVANLAAAFIRPQASPILAFEELGRGSGSTLVFGAYAAAALIAMAIGVLAWRRVQAAGAGIGLFGLLGGFVTLTRPGSHVTDVIPSLVGGIAAIATTAWLVRAGNRRTVYGSLTRESPGDGSLAYEAPGGESPAYEALVFGSPAYESPNHGSPAYHTGWTA